MIIEYNPKYRDYPSVLNVESAWGDIPTILKSIINDFYVNPSTCLEFGVGFGYSTSALANYFDKVVGVDTFLGDIHAGVVSDHFLQTRESLQRYANIELVQSTYQDFILKCPLHFLDLIHIDIIHTYEDTFACGNWALTYCNLVIFHDTESFTDVKRACEDLAKLHNVSFYNYYPSNGLGILYRA